MRDAHVLSLSPCGPVAKLGGYDSLQACFLGGEDGSEADWATELY
jgi:hypothetical protein